MRLRAYGSPRYAYDARLTSEVLRAFIRSLFAELRRRARNRSHEQAEQCGAITFLQRFAAELRSACASHAARVPGSALNLNVHFHTLALDGVCPYEPDHRGPGRFLPLPPPEPDEIARVLAGTARRIQRLIEDRHAGDEDALARDEPLMALLAAASLQTRIATGPHRGEPWRRIGDRVEPHEGVEGVADPEASDRVPQVGGMSLHADVAVPAYDRRRLERLCRYVARPPLAGERLEERPDGRLTLRLKTRWRDGTTHILMERSELTERLAPLIPPPRAHQVRYHGVLAPSASMRDRIVPQQIARSPGGASTERVPGSRPQATSGSRMDRNLSSPSDERRRPGGRPGYQPGTPGAPTEQRPQPDDEPRDHGIHDRAGRMRWAALLQRVFEVEALRCPCCGSTMRLIAAIEDPDVARRILECMRLPARAPPLGEATGHRDEPPSLNDDWHFDQSAGCDWP
jgi:hypothetical protein